MSSRFWTFVNNLISGQTARAEQVEGHLNQVDTAFGTVASELNRCIRFTSGTPVEADFQISDNAAARANKIVSFNGAGTD